MSNAYLKNMKKFLSASLSGAGINDCPITYNKEGVFFKIGESGLEVAFEHGKSMFGSWRVRIMYEYPDLVEGGIKYVGTTVYVGNIGDEVNIAKLAVLKIVESRIDSAIDSIA